MNKNLSSLVAVAMASFIALMWLGDLQLNLADYVTNHPGSPVLNVTALEALRRDGFVTMEGLIDEELVKAARQTIDAALERDGGCLENPEAAIHHSPELLALYRHTAVARAVEEVIGEGRVYFEGIVQVALVRPSSPDKIAMGWELNHHIDGIPHPTNSLEENILHPFTLLVGVYLSDVSAPDCGNLFLHPGSHRQYADYFRENPEQITDLFEHKMPPITLRDSVQIQLRSGGVILSNYLTSHGVALNLSPDTRYAIYFRLSSQSLVDRLKADPNNHDAYSTPWLDCWPQSNP